MGPTIHSRSPACRVACCAATGPTEVAIDLPDDDYGRAALTAHESADVVVRPYLDPVDSVAERVDETMVYERPVIRAFELSSTGKREGWPEPKIAATPDLEGRSTHPRSGQRSMATPKSTSTSTKESRRRQRRPTHRRPTLPHDPQRNTQPQQRRQSSHESRCRHQPIHLPAALQPMARRNQQTDLTCSLGCPSSIRPRSLRVSEQSDCPRFQGCLRSPVGLSDPGSLLCFNGPEQRRKIDGC